MTDTKHIKAEIRLPIEYKGYIIRESHNFFTTEKRIKMKTSTLSINDIANRWHPPIKKIRFTKFDCVSMQQALQKAKKYIDNLGH